MKGRSARRDLGRRLRPISAGSIDETTVRLNPIWRFSWDPAEPGTFTDITIASRGMGMDYEMPATAFDKIEFRNVRVLRDNGKEVDLYLDPAHMIGAWWTRLGRIFDSSSGLWRLDARVDCSLLVAFGFNLDAQQPSPLTREDCDALGDALIPEANLRPRGCEFDAAAGASAWVCVGDARYIVVVELVLCKENNDFVPGGIVGFARIQPHVMIWSNEDNPRVEASIVLARPRKAMVHGDAMLGEHKALLVTDANVVHNLSAEVEKPLPYTDLLYDYYEVDPARVFATRPVRRDEDHPDHPRQAVGEVTLADARKRRKRNIYDVVKRNSAIVGSDPDIAKEPRQGQFDNVHIAPRMKLELFSKVRPGEKVGGVDEVAMLNMCLHDCCHMHVRWSAFLKSDKAVRGWKGDEPYAEPGAPAVPENQTVFASFPNQHTLKYRAIAEGNTAGKPTVFCHHGLAYAIDVWPTPWADLQIGGLLRGMEALATANHEPFFNTAPNDRWALFYFRVRFCGSGSFIQPRSVFEVEDCMI